MIGPVQSAPEDQLCYPPSVGAAEITALAASMAAVGSVGTAIGAYRLGIRRFAHERELADKADARKVLAEGALELGRMKSVLKYVLSVVQGPLQDGGDWPSNVNDVMARFEAAVDALEAALAMVSIQFEEESDVVTEFTAANEDVIRLKNLYRRAWKRERSEGGRKEPGEDFEAAFQIGVDFDKHRKAYVAAAQGAVVVKLNNSDLRNN